MSGLFHGCIDDHEIPIFLVVATTTRTRRISLSTNWKAQKIGFVLFLFDFGSLDFARCLLKEYVRCNSLVEAGQ